ncbi:hypothetical protein FACS1894161_4970 [Spirochaetia bacterium]|nr:hypothetical protein FACS1894161_4970 [Spirochaetia bacterium]
MGKAPYKGFFGYHPLFAYFGAEGYMMRSELRPGSQHCQKGTPECIRALCADIAAVKLDKPALFRLDSGNDSADTLEAILRDSEGNKSGHTLIIKRNMRREAPNGGWKAPNRMANGRNCGRGKSGIPGRCR